MPNACPPEQKLENQLCFAVYAASRAITRAYRPLLDPLGLTYPQYLVLLVLWERGPATVKELGHALALDSGTLSPLLKRLEALRLVTRRRRTDDEREVEVAPTAKGLALREKALSVPHRLGCAMALGAEERRKLREGLRGLGANLARAAGEAA